MLMDSAAAAALADLFPAATIFREAQWRSTRQKIPLLLGTPWVFPNRIQFQLAITRW
jgi:hypothetical protein